MPDSHSDAERAARNKLEAAGVVRRDPVVEEMSRALAAVLSRRGGNWVPEPQWQEGDAPDTADSTGGDS